VRGRVTNLVVGILIVEDLIAILLLALLTPAAASHGVSAGPLGLTILRLVACLAALLAAGMLLVPRLVRYVVRLQRPETTLLVSIGICFATALLAHSIGYSVALGAFLAGSLVAESGEEKLVERLIEPVRDMFAAVFFVSVGMMFDPVLVAERWAVVLLFTVLVVVGKFAAVSLSAFLTGSGTRTAVQAGMSLAQIGEFSFIIAGVGLASGATSPSLYPIVVAVSAITTLTTPWLIRAADPVAAAVDRNLPRPLQTFVALYGSWIESIRARRETSADKIRTRLALRGLLIDAFVVLALAVGASAAARPLGERLASAVGLPSAPAEATIVGIAILLSAPFLVGIVRTGRALAQALARRAFPEPEPNRLDLAAAPRRALVVTLQLTTVLIVVAPLVAITQPFLPPLAGAVFLGASVVVLAIVIWRTATDLQGHVRAAAEAIVDAIDGQSRPGAPDEAERALQRAYQLLPGLGEPFPVRIEESSPAVGRRLSQLGLRGRTGATIVAISRGEEVVLVPDGHERLQAGDVVALAGTRNAIESAKHLLLQGRET
jgi:CPA2 family monovalent cation:H+ antiporter-2